jgi:RNA binding exosome subunit
MAQTKQRLLHHVTISVFCKPHDEKTAVLAGLDILSPLPTGVLLAQEAEYDPERPKTIHYRMPDIEFTIQQTETDEGKMIIYTLFFRKMSAVNEFARKISLNMTPEERKEYQDEPEKILDAEGKLSVRIDKELLMQGKISLTDDGNCYQVRASVAAYPKNEERILEAVKKILEQT